MGSSIGKAFKKVVNNALGTVGLDKDPQAPKQEVVPAAAPEQTVPDSTIVTDENADTQADQKRTKRIGKSGLQVSRTSGGGISI